MKTSVETKNGTAIITISGRMIFYPDLFIMRKVVQEEIANGIRRFVVDLSDVPFMDSSGLGELISIYTSITRVEGSMVLTGISPRIRLLLDRIRVTEIFTIVEKPQE